MNRGHITPGSTTRKGFVWFYHYAKSGGVVNNSELNRVIIKQTLPPTRVIPLKIFRHLKRDEMTTRIFYYGILNMV